MHQPRLPRALRWRRLSAVQRSLLIHVALITFALLLGHFTDYAWLAATVASLATLLAVGRLMAKPTLRTVLVRSFEPLLIIWGGLINLQLISRYVPLNSQVVTISLIVLLMWQARFFLLQFDPARHESQSLHTLMLMWLTGNALALALLESPAYLPAVVVATWAIQYSLAHFWLERIGFHNSFVAATWALLMSQLVWLASFVMIVYQLPLLGLFVTRLSLMIVVMGYAWGSLLQLHSQRILSKKLMVEYGMISALALGILVFLPTL